MPSSLPRVAFWLVPGVEERGKIQKIISALAKQFDSPPFVPHVTLYSCLRSTQQLELSVMSRIARDRQCVIADVDRLKGTEKLTQALYISLESNRSMQRLNQQLHTLLPRPSHYTLAPHLSLLYQSISFATRDRLIGEIALDLNKVHFAEMWAVAIPEQIKTPDDLAGWQTLLSCQLAPSGIVDSIESSNKVLAEGRN